MTCGQCIKTGVLLEVLKPTVVGLVFFCLPKLADVAKQMSFSHTATTTAAKLSPRTSRDHDKDDKLQRVHAPLSRESSMQSSRAVRGVCLQVWLKA